MRLFHIFENCNHLSVDATNYTFYRLHAAEEAVLSKGGNVIRLAGLYTISRGPHEYWLRRVARGGGVIQGSGDSMINLLHYEDAASAVISLMHRPGDDVVNINLLFWPTVHG